MNGYKSYCHTFIKIKNEIFINYVFFNLIIEIITHQDKFQINLLFYIKNIKKAMLIRYSHLQKEV